MDSRVSPLAALCFLWLAWVASWMAAAFWSDRTVKRAPPTRELPYSMMALIGAVLLLGSYHHSMVLWRIGRGGAWCMVVLATIGLMFSWWARIHLGRMWSRWIVRKADHHIVQTGPYALVRHPIYTGIILATLATAPMIGTVFAYFGAVLMILSWYIKARLEERFLREELGAGDYDTYVRRVPMLVPFLRI